MSTYITDNPYSVPRELGKTQKDYEIPLGIQKPYQDNRRNQFKSQGLGHEELANHYFRECPTSSRFFYTNFCLLDQNTAPVQLKKGTLDPFIKLGKC